MRCPTLKELPPPPPGKTGWPWTEESPQLPDTMPNGCSWPRISIVTPSYNQGIFLEKTIRSILLQGYPNLEYVVIDGGSTDNSIKTIKKYEPWITHWESKKDKGQAHAINKGFSKTTGTLINWINSDDYLLPNALYKIAVTFLRNQESIAWIGGCRRETPKGKVLSVVIPKGLDLPDYSRWGIKTHFYQPSCFFSYTAFKKVGELNENLHFAMDLDLYLRLSRLGGFTWFSDIISAAIIHDNAKTQAQRLKMDAETIAVQVSYGFIESAEERLLNLTKCRRSNTIIEKIKRRMPRPTRAKMLRKEEE